MFGDDALASGVVRDLRDAGVPTSRVSGGPADWTAAGLELLASPDVPEDPRRLDYMFWLHDRHDGNLDASAAYIAWEQDLPRQVGDHHNARFRIRA